MQPEDSRLIAREPAIVGLKILLDESEMLNLLQKQLPNAGIYSVKRTYLRYKPGTNCLVKYDMLSQCGSSHWYAKAYTSKDTNKLNGLHCTNNTKHLAPIAIRKQLLILYPFPIDAKLKLLSRLFEPHSLQALFMRVLYPNTLIDPHICNIELLQYKPERRFVAKLEMSSGEAVVLKAYTRQRYQLANLARRQKLYSQHLLDVVGRSNKHHLLVHRWIEGVNLTHYYHCDQVEPAPFYDCGSYLANFHQHSKSKRVVEKETHLFIHDLERSALGIIQLVPDLESQITALSTQLFTALKSLKSSKSVIHGDCYAKQILMTPSGIRLIDFDDVCYWFSGYDLGLFIAHLERDELLGTLSSGQTQSYKKALLQGYRKQRKLNQCDLELFTAIGLLQLTHHPFRNAQRKWTKSIRQIVQRCKQHLSSYQLLNKVTDFDEALPVASELFDKPIAEQILRDNIRHLSNEDHLLEINIVRHKPTKRALIEYTVERPNGERQSILGKVRIKRFDRHAWNVNHALYQDQFGQASYDDIMVPEPLGFSAEHHVWFQTKVAGQTCFEAFCSSRDGKVAERIAQALYKLHSIRNKTERHHTIENEIGLLEQYLIQASDAKPSSRNDIQGILSYCIQHADNLQIPTSSVSIHRDFYHDQILVDNDRIYLLDLDLCSNGDPALDIGNFIAHIEEQCLRYFNQTDSAQKQIDRFIEHYQQLAGGDLRQRIETYTLLSWARHIFISQRISERNRWTEQIIQVCKGKIRQNTN